MKNLSKPDFDTVIDAGSIQRQYIKDIFRQRELIYFFAWRDILVRYKQAFFGIAWALIRPLLTMLLFTLVFSRMAHLPSEGISYPLFVLAGMLPWQIFSNTIADSCHCMLNNSNLILKVYFPRIIIPTSQMIVHLLDFLIGVIMLIILAIFLGVIDPLTFLAFPIFVLLTAFLCLGGAFWLSALAVKYRDFRFIIPFVVQFGMFVSPVGYGTFLIPEKWIWLYQLNPLAGIIDGFRWSLFGISYPYFTDSIIISVIMTLIILTTGFMYFRNMEQTFADTL